MSDTTIDDAKSAITLFQRELEKLRIRHNDSDVSEFVTVSAGLVNQVASRDTSIDEFIDFLKGDFYVYLTILRFLFFIFRSNSSSAHV